MARGWGRSEEDLGADKEQARESAALRGSRLTAEETKLMRERRSLELALARIREQLPKVKGAQRRLALEAAKSELETRLEKL